MHKAHPMAAKIRNKLLAMAPLDAEEAPGKDVDEFTRELAEKIMAGSASKEEAFEKVGALADFLTFDGRENG